jgi:hypothetical protein
MNKKTQPTGGNDHPLQYFIKRRRVFSHRPRNPIPPTHTHRGESWAGAAHDCTVVIGWAGPKALCFGERGEVMWFFNHGWNSLPSRVKLGPGKCHSRLLAITLQAHWKQFQSYWKNPPYSAMRNLMTALYSVVFGTVFWRKGKNVYGPTLYYDVFKVHLF